MQRTRLIAGVAATLTALFAVGAAAGTLEPDLLTAAADRAPDERVDAIIRCASPTLPADLQSRNGKSKRTELIESLRAKSGVCLSIVARELAGGGGTELRELWLINAVAAKVRVDRLERLAQRPGVESIELNQEVRLPVEPQPPAPMGLPDASSATFWNLSEVRIPDLWALGYYGQGIVVASLDTGVDLNHVDLAPNWRGGNNSWYDPHKEHPLPYDANGHGTGTMGLMIGGDSTGVYIGAAPGAQWIAAKIFDDAGTSDYVKIHQSFQWVLDPDHNAATDDAPNVVNNSWALTTTNVCDGEFAQDVALLRAVDIAVVFSAGNYGPSGYTSVEPANDPGSLSVGAVDYYRTVLLSSSRGPSACDGSYYPGLVAPGRSVYTTALTSTGTYPQAIQYGTGTSFASPHVAGVMAILKGAVPDATVDELESAIIGGALDLGVAGPDNTSGAGYLDAVEAYYLVAGGTTPLDSDGDGVADHLDQCPGTPIGETVNTAGCALSQLDSDGDGVSDALDQCPNTPAGEPVDATGCPVSQTDSDGDGVSDALDQCPNTPPGELVDAVGCSASQKDSDGDGVSDALDQCPNTPPGESVDATGCSASQKDSDGDGVSDALDQCPGTPTGTAVDATGCEIQVGEPQLLYLSLDNFSGTLAGLGPNGTDLAYRDEDILSWNGTNFAMVFKGSAAALPSTADIVAFAIDSASNRILMSFRAALTLPGIAGTVGPSDIVAYHQTTGTFSLFFRGLGAGLDTTSERIDAIELLSDGRIVISTIGNPSVPGFTRGLADEDLIAFTPTSLGETTSGTWELYFDGSDVGLSTTDEDVDAAAVGGDGRIYLSTLGNFAVSGLSGEDEDVFVCTPTALGATTACSGFSLFFDGTTKGLTGDDVDAIDVQ
jgi:bacillopeptidase F